MRTVRPLLPLLLAALAALLGGIALGAASGAAAPRCLGAAARVPGHPCRNPALARTVTPTPEDALLVPDSSCAPVAAESTGVLDVCAFGADPGRATRTIALLGDSHASHWRAALDVAARRAGWRGLSLTKSSCPFSQADARIAPEAQEPCREHNVAVVAWLARHPEVATVFVSAHSGARVFTHGGRSQLDTKLAGYAGAWRALPASVRRIVVLRDVPTHPRATSDCIDAAIRARADAGRRCAVRRRGALVTDPEVVAVRRLRSPRLRTVDLTSFMCDASRCYPVVGGVLVNKDTDHLSQAFSTTLGPYLLSRARRYVVSR